MVAFLLIISFIIHMLSIYSIFILHRKTQAINTPVEHELHPILESYLNEIKEENKKLQQLVSKNEQLLEKPAKRKERNIPAEDNYAQIWDAENNDDKVETSLHAKILSLHEKGLSIDQIAKQLKCGQTEAELILKFHEKL